MELAVKLESALVKYLQGLNPPYPDYFDPASQVKPGEAAEDIDAQYLRCRAAEEAVEEIPLDTGNFMWDGEVELRTPCASATESETSGGTPTQLEKHQAMAEILEAAILVDDLPAQMMAAASALGEGYELTVFAVQNRQPARSQDDEVYSSGWRFRVYCCSSDVA